MSDDPVYDSISRAQAHLYDAVVYAIASGDECTKPQANALFAAYLTTRDAGDQWPFSNDCLEADPDEDVESEAVAKTRSMVEEMDEETDDDPDAKTKFEEIRNSRFGGPETIDAMFKSMGQLDLFGSTSRDQLVADIKANVTGDAEYIVEGLHHTGLIEPCYNGRFKKTDVGKELEEHYEDILDDQGGDVDGTDGQ